MPKFDSKGKNITLQKDSANFSAISQKKVINIFHAQREAKSQNSAFNKGRHSGRKRAPVNCFCVNIQRFLSLVLVEEINGEEKIVGLSVSQRIWTSKIFSNRDAYILIFVIDADFQSKGYNSLLLSVTNKINAYHYQAAHIMIDNFKDNVFLFNFFKENDFIAYQVKKGYNKIKDKEFDAVMMAIRGEKVKNPEITDNVSIHPEVEQLLTTKDRVPCLFASLRAIP